MLSSGNGARNLKHKISGADLQEEQEGPTRPGYLSHRHLV